MSNRRKFLQSIAAASGAAMLGRLPNVLAQGYVQNKTCHRRWIPASTI